MTPYALWRSRLPAQIGTWFARDLTRNALTLVEGGRVVLRSVEPARIEAAVKDKPPIGTAVEWSSGTGPQALRAVCTCGATGVCEHVVATLEVVRTAEEAAPPVLELDGAEPDLSWLPEGESDAARARARAVWPVLSVAAGGALTGTLFLDTPRLRGVIRDADAILAMMDQTPADDWDDVDRTLLRDDAVQEAFGSRASAKALARALFRLARHPRLRFDEAPGENRHPSELAPFAVETRGVRLRAVRAGAGFVPVLEAPDGAAINPSDAAVVDGPPPWLVAERAAYLLDGSFDARRVIAAARAAAAAPVESDGVVPSVRAIARVAPFLTPEERADLGVVDVERPGMLVRAAWREGALLARLAFVDRAGGAFAPFSAHGAVTTSGKRFVRWAPDVARSFARRFLEAGFVPRGGDSFALHDADRAAEIVRTVWPSWDDVDVRLDESLAALAGGGSVDVSVSATAAEAGDWFELDVSVFVGGGEPLTREELRALLGAKGRFAEVRGKLVDIGDLRSRQNLLSELTDRRRTGLASLVAMRDELHEAFGDVALPEEVERIRERLRNFAGIEEVEPPEILEHVLRDYQRRGLDFLTYLSSFRFGGILADDMGVGKAQPVSVRVLTPDGWQRFGDLKVGDSVMNAEGGISRVTGIYPQGDLPAFRVIFSDGSSTVCSDDHLWLVNSAVRKRRGVPPRVLPLSEIRKRLYDGAGNARHYIPIARPMRFGPAREYDIDPYVMGCLLGDGGISGRSSISLTTADEDLIEECRRLAPTGTEIVQHRQYGYRVRMVANASDVANIQNVVRVALARYGLMGRTSEKKFIPTEYLLGDATQRLSLLQGLMDTDGCVDKRGHVEFYSSSEDLADGVGFLVRSLGGTIRMNYRPAPKYRHKGELRIGKPSYRVSIALDAFNPFRIPRKAQRFVGRPKYQPSRAIVDVLPLEPREMQCIAVDAADQLYITDDFIVTHNTVQVIAHIVKRKEMEGEVPVLVIAPTSVTHTWENEIKKFAPTLRTLRLQSGSDRAAKYETIFDYDVVVTSYALARLDAAQLERFRFRTLVLDEAQNTKNPGSQIAKVVRGLQADHRLALTGTPVENSLRDLWAIFGFVEPGLLGSEASFRRRFELPIADGDEGAAAALRSRLEPFLLRRTKEDVARELPERTEAVIECELTPLQRRLYRGIAEAARRDVLAKYDEEGAESATVHVLAALTRLRQVCAHPGLLVPEYLDDPEASGKFDAFIETVEEVLDGGHKVLVFSAFASMLRIMRTALERRNIAYGYLDGSTKDRDRQTEVDRFMSDDGPPVFLCSLKAGGVGLTLTAADYVVLYDPWWNPAVERQAIDRTHRIGQTRPVTAYRMVTAGSVEEKIRALAERKTALSKAVVKADSAVAKTLTREDLAFLFSDPE